MGETTARAFHRLMLARDLTVTFSVDWSDIDYPLLFKRKMALFS